MPVPHPFGKTTPLHERLAAEVTRLRRQARALTPERQRELLLRRARQDAIAIKIDAWLRSPGLRAPT